MCALILFPFNPFFNVQLYLNKLKKLPDGDRTEISYNLVSSFDAAIANVTGEFTEHILIPAPLTATLVFRILHSNGEFGTGSLLNFTLICEKKSLNPLKNSSQHNLETKDETRKNTNQAEINLTILSI